MRCLKDRQMGLPLLAALVVAILAVAGPADAQVLYGSIVGNVADSSQAAIPGATVTAIRAETNLARETTSSGSGAYTFSNLPEGTYTVRVTLQGFKEHVEEGVPVRPNAVSRVDVTLAVGALTETITVQSERALLQTDSGDLHSELNAEEIGSLPLGNYRNYQSLMNLVPGVTPAREQNAITDAPGRALSANVNGTARNNNNTRLDGATNIYIWLPHHAVYIAPAETVDTVNVATASFDAEQGMAGGAAVSVLTKSGTNEFHGSGTFLFENDSLRARNWSNDGDKPESDRKIGAVTLGGPIIKDKLFFFGGWEGHYTSSPSTRTGTLPTAAHRAGDFSAYDTVIYDPATGNADGTGRTPFPNNKIPANRIDPTALAIQNLIPLPNKSGDSANYTDSGLIDFNRDNYDFKLNWNVTNSTMFWAKYSQMNGLVESDMWLGAPSEGGIGGYGYGAGSGVGDTVVKIGTVGFTWTVSPTFVVDATASHMRFDQEAVPPDFGTNWGSEVFGIPGTNGDGGGAGDDRYSGLPYFGINGFEALGGPDGWTPLFRNDRSSNFSINSTLIQGSHELRFGFDVVKMELNHWQPELGNPRGSLNFNGRATALAPSGSPNFVNGYAQFLLGLTSSTDKSIQYELQTGREWQYGLYVRDRWQVNRNLTLTLGLRWEKYPIMKRADRGIELYNQNDNTVTLCGRAGVPDDCGIKVEHPQFLPRVGFSYRLGENNVIRGGFGRTVSPIPNSRPLRGFYPLTIANNFESPSAYAPYGTFASGIPLFYGPDRDAAIVDMPISADIRTPYPDTLTRGYIDSWNLTFERRLPWDMSLSAGYVGTRTKNQMGFYNINASTVGAGQEGKLLYAPFGRTGYTARFDGYGKGNYHSLQMALNKPFGGGLFVKAAYTWSKAMNEFDDEGWANVIWYDPAASDKNYSFAGFDRTHIFQLGFVWEMPFGRDGDGVLAAIVKDWSLNGTFAAFSGTPFRVSSSSASVNSPGNAQSADRIAEPNKLGGIGRDNPYYDPSAWAAVTEVRYGNEGRNSMRGPGMMNLDLGLFRRFALGSKVNLELRAEGFNITNTPHFSNPSGNRNSGNFMRVTGTNGSFPERQFRLGARVSF